VEWLAETRWSGVWGCLTAFGSGGHRLVDALRRCVPWPGVRGASGVGVRGDERASGPTGTSTSTTSMTATFWGCADNDVAAACQWQLNLHPLAALGLLSGSDVKSVVIAWTEGATREPTVSRGRAEAQRLSRATAWVVA